MPDSSQSIREQADQQARDIFQARSMIEAFRLGIVPSRWTEEFTFGRDRELASFKSWLDDEHFSPLFVVGEYGSGKTHLLNTMRRHALRAGFAVAGVAVDLHQAPFHHPKRIYAHLIRSFRFINPSTGREEGFRSFLAGAMEKRVWTDHPYFSHLFGNLCVPGYWEWIEAREALARPGGDRELISRDLPGLYDVAGAANQYCFLLSSLGWAAREVWSLPGLLLSFDEAEILEITPGSQAEKGLHFINTLLRTAVEEPDMAKTPRDAGVDVYRHTAEVPFLYRNPAGLKLMFAFTSTAAIEGNIALHQPVRLSLSPLPEKTLRQIDDRIRQLYERAYRYVFPRPVRVSGERSWLAGHARLLVKRSVETLDIVRWRSDARINEPQITRVLPRSVYPFFSRFGNLTPVQEQLVEPVLTGRNTAVFAPRLYGRIEAALAPLAERVMSSSDREPVILVVVPSYASGEDLACRIRPILQKMNIATWHSSLAGTDLPDHNQPSCLILTPETLDSLFGRFPGWFKEVRGVVLDDLHLLDGTSRGDQLRVLLYRLGGGSPTPSFSTHLFSSSLTETSRVVERYLPRAEVVESPLPRDIQAVYLSTYQDVFRLIRSNDLRKVLYLFNSPATTLRAERLIRSAPGSGPVENLTSYHSTQDRQRIKDQIKEMDTVTVLEAFPREGGELGSSYDLVVLAEPPWSMMTLYQRMGRGDLRDNRSRLAFLARSEREREGLRMMVEGIRHGQFSRCRTQPYGSSAIQQVFSFVYQLKRLVSLEELIQLLSPLYSETKALVLLSRLRRSGWLCYHRAGWEAGPEVMSLGERGLLHSNQPIDRTFEVWDRSHHRCLGHITAPFDQVFLLKGDTWQVTSFQRGEVRVDRYTGELVPDLFTPWADPGFFSLPDYPGIN